MQQQQQQQQRVTFSADEIAQLGLGISVMGLGNWKDILEAFEFHSLRTSVSLKDLNRTLERKRGKDWWKGKIFYITYLLYLLLAE
jgi:hypothetical protein